MEKKIIDKINEQIRTVAASAAGADEFHDWKEEMYRLYGMIEILELTTGKKYRPTKEGLQEV